MSCRWYRNYSPPRGGPHIAGAVGRRGHAAQRGRDAGTRSTRRTNGGRRIPGADGRRGHGAQRCHAAGT